MAACETEGVELRPDHADAESGRGALVRAYRDEPAAGAAAAQVRDTEREDDEAPERQERVPVGVACRVEVDAEQVDFADLGAGDAAGAFGVVQDEALEHERQPEGGDREVHAAGAQRRQRDDQPDRDGAEHADERRELERQVVVHDEASCHPCACARERELRERELAGVARDDDEGQHDDRCRCGRRRGLDAVRRQPERDHREADRDGRDGERGAAPVRSRSPTDAPPPRCGGAGRARGS